MILKSYLSFKRPSARWCATRHLHHFLGHTSQSGIQSLLVIIYLRTPWCFSTTGESITILMNGKSRACSSLNDLSIQMESSLDGTPFRVFFHLVQVVGLVLVKPWQKYKYSSLWRGFYTSFVSKQQMKSQNRPLMARQVRYVFLYLTNWSQRSKYNNAKRFNLIENLRINEILWKLLPWTVGL